MTLRRIYAHGDDGYEVIDEDEERQEYERWREAVDRPIAFWCHFGWRIKECPYCGKKDRSYVDPDGEHGWSDTITRWENERQSESW